MALGAEPTYTSSDATLNAKKRLNEAESSYLNRDPFSSQYTNPLVNTTEKYMNRQKFSYNYQNDPIYLGIKDRYINQGGMASVDAMAQAAARTGGYDNSYADTLGQQTYQNYLNKAFDQIPELASQAYQRYQDEGNQLLSQINLLQTLENTDYQRYQDVIGDLWNDLQYAQSTYQFLTNQDFNYYKNNLDKWLQDREYYYQKGLLDQTAAEVGYSPASGGNSAVTGTATPTKKSNEQLAAEVWQGKWGSGQERADALTKAGYDYWAVQDLVNRGVGR